MKNLVQQLIASQPNGIKLAEMEKNLRQSRLHLGYITKVLVEEGKVFKVENKYYPVESVPAKQEGVESPPFEF